MGINADRYIPKTPCRAMPNEEWKASMTKELNS
jgi:hypothetical protein